MHVDTQISRGLERIMARNAGAYLEGLYGLAGFGSVETFGDLEDVSQEAGVPNAAASTRRLRRAHRCACQRMKDALPVAVAVQAALEETNGPAALPLSHQAATLAGIEGLLGATKAAKQAAKATKAAAKAQKKIAKIEAKEAKQEAKVAAKVAKLQAAGKTAKAEKVIAKDAKQDAKVAAKITKQQGVIAAANAAVQALQAPAAQPTAAVTPSTPVTPTETAAAVLTNQAQLPATPAVQQLAQEVVANAVAPGSALPAASLTTPTGADTSTSLVQQQQPSMWPPSFVSSGGGGGSDMAPAASASEEPSGMFGGVSPVVVLGGAGLLLFLVMNRKGSR